MNTSITYYIILLCIATVSAMDNFTFFSREPGDRPIYVQTLESIETEEIAEHHVYHEWFGVNETFTLVYLEVSNGLKWASMNQLAGPEDPLHLRNFLLEVAAENTTQLTVNFIVFGFVNQPPTHPGAGISLLKTPPSGMVKRIFNGL